MATAVFQLLRPLIRSIQPVLIPLCFVAAWTLLILVVWNIWTCLRDTAHRTRQMHQIPCAHCRFFTQDYFLKCTVHPSTALTEEAINCRDYVPIETGVPPSPEQS